MKIEQKVNIHNRFDIEVRDKDTGEIKQTGECENILLDNIYRRLCNGNSYFDSIEFGSGVGEVSPARTSLFKYIGRRSATTEELIRDFPVSKWVRSIELKPDEFVGETITEVGIYGNHLNSHALIRDSEGNPLEIVKTDTDIIKIYATVFIELFNKNESIYFTDLPNDNRILNYLTGTYFNTSNQSFNLYKDAFKENLSHHRFSSKATRTTADIANKKMKFDKIRFEDNEGNGPIRKLHMEEIFNCILPEPSVYTNTNITEEILGIGDENNKVFPLEFGSVENIIVKKNDLPTTNFLLKSQSSFWASQSLEGIGSSGQGVSISGDTIVAASSGVPYFTVHKLIDGKYVKTQNLEGTGGIGRGVLISGDTIVTASDNAPYFTVHKLTDGKYVKTQNLEGTGGIGRGASISGDTIVTASHNAPYFTVHKLIDGEYVKTQDLEGVGSRGQGVSISGDTIVTASYNNYRFTVHKLTDGEYIKTQNLEGTGLYGQEVSILGDTIVTASDGFPWFTVHKLINGEYVKTQDLEGVNQYGRGISFSGDTIVTSSSDTPYSTVHKLTDGEYIKTQDLEGVSGGGEVLISGDTIVVVNGRSSFTIYKWIENYDNYVLFDTPPEEGAVITADYSVPYIAKTSDYVLDVSAEIVFGEGE